MGEIQILPELMINKIAAGEVVERPASVVKELLENAVDAGADQIIIQIKNGGKDLISILDNGKGMSAEDARLAIERHATSKIREMADLDSISTMGFRGEALAAIASVSRFELTTCRNEDEGGFMISLEGGKNMKTVKLGFAKGTRIKVENLFFNTPARLKFLKAMKTEYGHIYDTVIRTAMANPHIQFRLTHNQNISLNLPKNQSFRERIRDCFGSDISDSLIEIQHEESYLKFTGLISPPSACRPSKRWQHVFVNDRYVKDKTIQHSVTQGYKTLLMKHLFPVYFLKIELDPKETDVNVHPAKTEIRFRNQNLIHTILSEQIARVLKKGTREAFFQSPVEEPQLETRLIEKTEAVKPAAADRGFRKTEVSYPEKAQHSVQESSYEVDKNEQLGFPVSAPDTPARKEVNKAFVFAEKGGHETRQEVPVTHERPDARVIGQFSKYILADIDGRLVIIDKHAAHERIRFEEIKRNFYAKEVASQPLMIPVMLELPPQDGILLEQYQEEWEQLGFVIDHFGRNDYSVKEVPVILKDRDVRGVIREVLDELSGFGKIGRMELFFNQVFEKMACHSAIRGDQHMSPEEMDKLLLSLQELDLLLHCPHGRPVMVALSEEELDKKFKRVL